MRIVGVIMGSAGGSFAARVSSRRRAAFCAVDSPSCMGCSVRALRYAVAKSENASGWWGISRMRLKLGNRRAVVAPSVFVLGNDEAVIRTLVNGYQYFMLVNVLRQEL